MFKSGNCVEPFLLPSVAASRKGISPPPPVMFFKARAGGVVDFSFLLPDVQDNGGRTVLIVTVDAQYTRRL